MHFSKSLLIGFMVIYVLLIGALRSLCWKDPTLIFFQLKRAHASRYSTYRIQQAVRHAELASSLAETQVPKNRQTPPELCIGIPSVRREGVSYLKLALGSLQHGFILLAHVNQTEHPDYGQPWLAGMVDKLAAYHDDEERFTLAQTMESRTHAVKSKFDYSIVMEECEKTAAPYILIIEDDVESLDGWQHRTMNALNTASAKSWESGQTGCDFLLLTRRYMARAYLTQTALFLITLVFTLLLIILFFAAGRNCMLPQPSGVHIMDKYACCGQGLLFPRSTVTKDLLPFFRTLTPVVMQHVGGQSSYNGRRGDTYKPSRLWNFEFEQYDAAQLAEEHARAQYQLINDLEI
ncbi:integral membrane protein [Xylaria sp. FL1042]|nr:integral membrane protein [Xylaria sp. FL1042]